MKVTFLLSLLFISVIAQSNNQSTNPFAVQNRSTYSQPGNQFGNRTNNRYTQLSNSQNPQASCAFNNQLPPGIPTLTINIYTNFTIPPPLTLNQTIKQIQQEYPHASQADTVRDALPRFSGPEFQLDYSDPVPKRANNQRSDGSLGEWVKGTVFYIIPGAVFAVVALIAWIALIIKHCCFSSNKHASSNAIGHPTACLTVLIVSSIVVFVFSIVGLAFNVQLSNGLTNGDSKSSVHEQPVARTSNLTMITWDPSDDNIGVVTAGDKTISDLLLFTDQFQGLILRLIDTIDYTLPRISNQLVDASSVITQFDQLLNQFLSINQAINDFSIGNFSCSASPRCQIINQPINELMGSVSDVVFPVLNTIDSDVQSIQTNLVSLNRSINDQLYDAVNQINDVNQQAEDLKPDVDTVTENVRKYDKLRFGLTCAFFVLPVVFLIVSLIVCLIKYCKYRGDEAEPGNYPVDASQSAKPLLRRSLFLRIIIHLIFIVSILMWIIFATHLAVTSAIADTCVFVDAYQVSIADEFDATTANVVHACLLNTSLITALSIGSSINFAVDVVIPNVTSINQIFPVNQLTSAINQTDLLNLDSFGYSASNQASYRNTALDQVNRITSPDQFTIATINQLNVNQYPSNQRQILTGLKTGIILSLDAEQSINRFITQFRANLSQSLTLVNSITETSDSILTAFLNVGETVAPLINAGQVVIESAYCGELGKNAAAAKHSYCEKVLEAVGLLDLSSFIIALFCIPLIVCLCRFESWSSQHPHAHLAWKSPPQTPPETSKVNVPMYPVVVTHPPNYQSTNQTPYQPQYQSQYRPAVPPRPSAPSNYVVAAPGGYTGEQTAI